MEHDGQFGGGLSLDAPSLASSLTGILYLVFRRSLAKVVLPNTIASCDASTAPSARRSSFQVWTCSGTFVGPAPHLGLRTLSISTLSVVRLIPRCTDNVAAWTLTVHMVGITRRTEKSAVNSVRPEIKRNSWNERSRGRRQDSSGRLEPRTLKKASCKLGRAKFTKEDLDAEATKS